MPSKEPILFLVFNRPDKTQRVFERIRAYKPDKLFVAMDGARNSADEVKCKKVRAIIENVDWECDVNYLIREKNLGCKLAVSSAIDWFFDNVERGIILEDDCLPAQSFFDFTSYCLEKFKDDTRIGSIGGNNFNQGLEGNTIFYSTYVSIWGWATWRRAWSKYRVSGDYILVESVESLLKRHFKGREYRARLSNFKRVNEGKIDTWDYQWHLTSIVNNFLTVLPSKNLISNIGIDEEATHTKTGKNGNLKVESFDTASLVVPDIILFNSSFDHAFYPSFRLAHAIRWRWHRFLNSYCKGFRSKGK